jgi:methylase of polypeptide subunit release factors
MPRTSASAAQFKTGDDQEWLSVSYEASLGRAGAESKKTSRRRKQLGAFYTPMILADVLVELSLKPWLKERAPRACPTILDPACGSGNLLIAAARELVRAGCSKTAIASAMHGVDIDPIAVSIARTRLAHFLRLSPAAARQLSRQVRVGDALFEKNLQGAFDIVLGNPPFLNQLIGATVVDRRRAQKLVERFDGAVRGYADMASAFLLLGAQALKPGGRMAMIEPVSVLSAAHAHLVREGVGQLARLECIYFERQRWASASTHVAILAFASLQSRGAVNVGSSVKKSGAQVKGKHALRAVHGIAATDIAATDITGHAARKNHGHSLRVLPSPALTLPWSAWQGRWSAAMAAHAGVPRMKQRSHGVIGDRARVAADFRDQYYGLRGAIKDSKSSHGLRIVTTGLIDWAHCMWGDRPVRLLGKVWKHPEANERTIADDPYMKDWLADAKRPKVLVAVQTKALEAVVDTTGHMAPSVPLIRVVPHKRADLWRILAVVLSPATSAEAWWRHAGAGLSPHALKLSAKQIAALPLPTNISAWNRAADVLEKLHHTVGAAREKRIDEFAWLAMEASEVAQEERAALWAWWRPLITHRDQKK